MQSTVIANENPAGIYLSIVVPIYNEVDSLPLLDQALHTAMQDVKCTWEVIYVDDGSRDGSVK